MRWTVPVPTNTFRKPLSHLAFGRAVYLRPTEFHTLGDGALEACFYSLSDHRRLKLSKRTGYLEDELPHRGRRIDGLLVQVQVHAVRFEVLDRVVRGRIRRTKRYGTFGGINPP